MPVRRLAATSGVVFLTFLLSTCGGEGPTQPKQVATQLAFVVSPGSTAAGTAFSPAVQVAVLDAAGHQVSGFADTVRVTMEANPGNGALSGTSARLASGGMATFTDLSINRPGAGYRLRASASGLTAALTGTFNIVAGPAASLTFTSQPAPQTNGGSLITPAVQVTALDAQGNVADGYSGAVTIGITPGTGSGGAILSGTTTVNAVAGIATFATLRIDKAAAGYTLTASASGITSATSSSLTIDIGPASGLAFTAPPANTVAGTPIGAIQVSAVDSGGNVVTSYTGDITVAIGTNAGGGTLSGTTTATAAAGVATFSTLRIDKSGVGYTLAATGTGLGGGTSPPFNIDAGPAVELAVTVQPNGVSAGTLMSPPVQVTARDSLGNTATSFTGDVTIAIGVDSAGGTLSGTKTVAAVGGIATFTDVTIDKVGSGYTLVVSSAGLPSVSTVPFAVAPGAAAQLAVTVEPTSSTGGAVLAPAIQVIVRDALGNTATNFAGSVTAAIGANPGAGTLSGTKTAATVAGIATFSALSIDKAANGYTLSFSAPGLSAATSAPFDIAVGPASRLAFTVQPATTTAGAMVTPAVQVAAQDAGGNIVTGYASDVTVALGANPSSGTLSGTTTVTPAGGVAAFSTLSIDRSGAGYTLTASATGVTSATSATFSITPGPATQLAVTIQPAGAVGGAVITPAVQVTAQDALGNTATAFTGTVTATIGTNLAGGTLSGLTTVPAVAGVASFSTLSIDRAGSGYALAFAANGLTGATSAPFDVVVGAASQLAFTFPPSPTTAGATITPAVTVSALDAGGNTVTGFTSAVTLAFGTNPANGTLSGTTTVAAVAGVATFSTLSINKSGAGYTLTATAAGVTAATSPQFTINPGPASQLAVTVQPTNTTDGATITPAVQLTAQDALGNTATGFTGTVTLGIQTNPGSGTLSGTTTKTAVAGVVAFSDLSIDKTGSGYTLVGTSPGLTGVVSAPFAITPGAATQLVFSVQPSTTAAGTAISPAIQVSALTALGNLATGFTGNVTLTIGANVSGGTLTGTTTIAAAAGVATFATLSIDKAGAGYTLLANASGVTTATSAPFTITAGSAAQLVFSVQPTAAVAGTVIAPAVKVTARDALGNTATTFTGNVTVAIAANPGGGSLSGTATVAALSGVATFSNLSINKSGAGYTLSAVAAGVTGATSASFTIAPGTATQLAFTIQPGTTTAGAAVTPAIQVAALDALGNTATGYTGTVAIAIATNPAAGTLSGTPSIAAVAGVATFADLSIDKSGAGYTLSATATGLTAATSTAFAIVPGPASQLVITIQPSNTTGGAVITPAVRVTARDALGNTATGFTGEVTATIQANPGGGALSGTSVVAAAAGIANFSTLSIDKAGSGYTLAVSSPGLTGATSAPFDVTVGPASRLGFTVSPATTTAGATIAPAVTVTALDAGGNAVTSFTGNVAVAITPGTGTAGATLSGTTTVAAVSGVATYANLSVNKSGSGYTLSASSSGLTGAVSTPFAINPGVATLLAITVQPTNTTAGAAITPAVQVTARDALGNTATGFVGDVTMAIQANPGSGTLSGTTTVTAVAGVASFPTLSIDKSGSGYTLSASAAGLTGATSNVFSILVGAASHLAFTVQPVTTAAGATITPAVQVSAQDGGGNLVTSFTGTVTVAVTAGTGTAGATLLGTTSVSAVGGVATFSTLKINTTGSGYTLTAAANALSSAVSAAFDINTGPATQLKFTVQPAQTNAGATMTPAIEVTAQDAVGNTATTFSGNVSIAIGTNPGGGTLSGTTTVAAVNGVAVFSTLSIDKTATGYTLVASASGLSSATSAAFTIKTGAATQVVFTAQPTITSAGATITPAVQVTARDGFGNTATGFTGVVTVAIGANPSGGTLSGTTSVAAVAGVATFADLSIDQAGSGYTLTANAAGLPGATSTPFDISATSLAFTAQPSTTTAGAKITPAVQVTARDALGHTITTFTGKVTVAILAGSGAPGATLSGTTQVSAVAGVASFSTLSIDKAASGYKLTAAASGFPSGVSSSFTINAGAATKLGFIVQPSTTPAGATIIPAVQVAAQDALGNTVKSFTGSVTMTISTNPSSGTLSGTTSVLLNAGVAAFSTLSINKAGVGYKLRAAVTGLTSATSAAFDVTPAAATMLFFEMGPSTTTAGEIITPAVVVTAQDSMGNTVTSFTGAVTVLITAGSGTTGATLFGTTTVSAVSGVATFSDLRIDKAGTGYKLSASASGVAGKNSGSFQIIAGTPVKLSFSVQPSNATAGAVITPAVEVTVRDSLNNVVKTFTDSITVSIAVNPSGGTLSGTTAVAATAGIASFGDLSINLAGVGYRLQAAANGLAAATSSSFTISP